MRLTFLPVPFVYLWFTNKLTKTTLLIVNVISLISFTIWPDKYSVAIHFAFRPFAIEVPTILPSAWSFTVKFVVFEVSFVFYSELGSDVA